MSRTKGEDWVISRLREKAELDLFEFATPGSNQLGIDPADAITWSSEHKLSAGFLRELLTEESIDGVALPASLWLTRIWCSENIDLSGCAIKREVIFELCRFEKEFAARAAKFESNLWFSRCSIGSILMDDCTIDGTFKIEGTVDGDLWAMNSKFGRSLTLYGTVAGEVSLQHSEIDQGLDAHGLIANEANLEGISVKSALNLSNAKLTIGLWAADIVAQSSLYLGGVETEGTIEFSRARVAGSIDLANVKAGRIIGENASIAGDVFASKAQAGSISLISTEIRDDLRLEGAALIGDLLLLRARIGGYFILATEPSEDITWGQDSNLVLTDLSVGIFTTTLSTLIKSDRRLHMRLPSHADFVSSELSGFRFNRIGSESSERSIISHGARDLVAWIESANAVPDLLFNPTPYTSFSSALRNTGFNREADDILYAMYRHKMISKTQPRGTRLVMFLSWILIGFGYRAERAITAMLIFVFLGVWAGLVTEGWYLDVRSGSVPSSLVAWTWASIQNVVPFVSFGNPNTIVAPHTDKTLFVMLWNLLALLGAVTAAFLLAAISGFARRRYR